MTTDSITEWLKLLSQGNITPQKLDSSVPLRDRKLAYLCAAWLVTIDEQVADKELSKLEEIRAEIELDEATYRTGGQPLTRNRFIEVLLVT